ncbi:hypothetical protein [Geoalkalibacter halelectricus]|uniref:Uncharacterized protein n=1 Tax=Geoalkalibacter halelectricus TaxID=2847045 RepID=A0ABY5ZQ49_9BACT|nr:hypothetical protein [Geoalkalibacter halelectricus]MDO3377209.1 hypothetical protein [Geoalkalibacter halelectricus]UWZ79341.1 hypothetical protein L9S41_16910 [Geoalkalibacter halelectricus]
MIFANAKENLSPGLAGMAIGLVNTGVFLGAAIMQPLFGWVMDLAWAGTLAEGVRVNAEADYRLGFSLMFGFALLALVGALRVHESGCRHVVEG